MRLVDAVIAELRELGLESVAENFRQRVSRTSVRTGVTRRRARLAVSYVDEEIRERFRKEKELRAKMRDAERRKDGRFMVRAYPVGSTGWMVLVQQGKEVVVAKMRTHTVRVRPQVRRPLFQKVPSVRAITVRAERIWVFPKPGERLELDLRVKSSSVRAIAERPPASRVILRDPRDGWTVEIEAASAAEVRKWRAADEEIAARWEYLEVSVNGQWWVRVAEIARRPD